ncbi:MAG: hypothetical protein P8M20_04450, partial [Planctomycetaceae bacterium]|nr:hypothetical protein [Planctomycetaceae bacterium]
DLVNEVRFVPVPSLRLLEASFPVHEYVTAVRRDQSPVIPLPAETLLVITRREYVVRRGPVSRTEFQLLRAILDGNSLGAAIKIAAEAMPDMADEELASNLSKWFQHWASAGWFIRVELPDS